MSSGGAIWLHRAALDSWLWGMPPKQFKIAITILLKANWKPGSGFNGGRAIRVDRGQCLTSLDSLAKASGCSKQSVRTALNNLQGADFLTRESTRRGLLITVTNYDSYQSRVETDSTVSNTTPTRQQHDANTTATPIEEGKKERREEREVLDPLAEERSRDQRRADADALWGEFLALRKPLGSIDRGMREIGTWPGCTAPLLKLLGAGWTPDQIRHAMTCEVAAAEATKSAQYFDGVRNFTDDALRRCQGRTPGSVAAEALARKAKAAATAPKPEAPRRPKGRKFA